MSDMDMAWAEEADRADDLEEELDEARALIAEMLVALKRADQFITNGIELGFIKMPDASTPDPAHETPSLISAAIAKAVHP